MHIAVIIRPRAPLSELDGLRAEIGGLRDAGHDVHPRLTFEEGDAERFAVHAARSGAELIIAAGGDGTVNGVVNGAAGEGWTGPLGIIPTGTANDFAAGLGIPEELAAAMAAAVSGVSRPVDIARVNDRYFINASTGGFGAQATAEASRETKRLLGPLAYLMTGVKELAELRPSRARFTSRGEERYEGDVMLFGVGNGTRTGAGTRLTPDAELDDGELDVVIVPGMTRVEFAALAPGLRAGAELADQGVIRFRTDRLVVESEDRLSVNADGEALSGSRFEYGITGDALDVRVPG